MIEVCKPEFASAKRLECHETFKPATICGVSYFRSTNNAKAAVAAQFDTINASADRQWQWFSIGLLVPGGIFGSALTILITGPGIAGGAVDPCAEESGRQAVDFRPGSWYTFATSMMEHAIQCQRCAACCRWPGEVRLSATEVTRVAAFMNLTEQQFIDSHTRLRHDRKGLALKERSDHSCSFLESNACAIQAVKPAQCLEFPNRWVNLLWGKVPVEAMRRDYPMLFACAGFQAFLESHPTLPRQV